MMVRRIRRSWNSMTLLKEELTLWISWITLTLHKENPVNGYGDSLSHAWHSLGKWKYHLVLETQGRYFKVLIIWLRIKYYQSFRITLCLQTKIAWFDVNGSVEDSQSQISKADTGKRKRCKMHKDNCRSKSGKGNIVKPVQTAISIRRPLVKTSNAESAQTNFYTVITVWDDHLSNATSDHFFVSQIKKKPV